MNTIIKTFIEIPTIGEVEIFANLSDFEVENDGIGEYEYWGAKSYDAGTDYLHLEELQWDKSKYTDEQIAFIDNWIWEKAGDDDCPYQKLCDIAEKPYFEFYSDRY